MIKAVKLNNQTINKKDGLIYLDNLNETLDSGVIVVEGTTKLNINPMDEISIIFPDDVEKRFIVSEYSEEVASYEPARYNYQIQYVSLTIIFERITLPNLTITKVFKKTDNESSLIKVEGNANTTSDDYYTRSVGYYIEQYLDEYFPYKRYTIDSELMDKAWSTICPEMTFNKPTLREVLQALFDVLDLIFVYEYQAYGYYLIKGISPNVKKNAIDTSKLNNDVVRNSINTYASNLDIELSNAISSKVTSTEQILTFRSEEGILTTDNAKIILDNPIYAINYIQVNITGIPDTNNNGVRPTYIDWVDITKHVVEQSVYEGLESKEGSYKELTKYNTLYFKQGSKTIEGMGKNHKYLGIITSEPVLTSVILDSLYAIYDFNIVMGMSTEIMDFVDGHFFEIMFRISYETIQDVRTQTERTNVLPHQSVLFDSQEANYVNVENFAKNSLSKLNRMSNNERHISAIYTDYNDIPQLGDYIDDYILTNREISFYDNYIAFNGILTKDYSNIYQFNAINSKKRFYAISGGKDALIRNELVKYYVTFSYTENTLSGYEAIVDKFIRQSWLNPKYVLVKYYYLDDVGREIASTKNVALEVTSYSAGNSVLFSFGFDDNIVGGSKVGDSKTGGYYQQPVKYVDDYGENTKVKLKFYSNSVDRYFTKGSEYEAFWETYGKHYPEILDDNIGQYFSASTFEIDVDYHKDQREIQRWSLQFTPFSEDKDIIFGNVMIEDNVFFKNGYFASLDEYSVFKCNYTFDKNNVASVDTSKAEKVTDIHPVITDNYFTINASGNLAIASYNGSKILLALNNYVAGTPIYCNIRKTR